MKRTSLNQGTAHDTELAGASPGDYVVVDELGHFAYYPSANAMLEDLEYVEEAASILDRGGNNFHLTMEAGRKLRLGSSFGRVEFTWLRQTWITDRRREPQAHRLLRLYPTTLEALLAGIFETLTLELPSITSSTPWIVNIGGKEVRPATLVDVDSLLAQLDHLERVVVRDPFGHDYRPIRHARHRLHAPGAGAIYYVEIESHAGGAGLGRKQSESLP
ncbi:hypothetical protein [Arthrobacter bambusae]|uniref:hypothetical protein n=1 Tax=Arthrobacter bambusae TaxID=1338426 RepID=UPI0027866174|nr:hypothetical protein [Arthrobacter bambusae]MDQ0029902.1 hypothetical protein [Arthrobacter bambusae]MDQ0097580.1 hypothetical protein [Arthrobacter bambusae]